MKKIIGLLSIVTILFSSCQKELSDKEQKKFLLKGNEIAQTTTKLLGKNLMQQMKTGGTEMAIPFCNASANPLTEEMEKKYNVRIKRTSHKIRNEKNAPTAEEQSILDLFLADDSDLKPIVKKGKNGQVNYYAPIKMQGKCLACHGEINTNVLPKTDSLLTALYPKDLAKGFKKGDLRGIWSITFDKK